MSNLLSFRVSSHIKNILGRELITDDFIAVFELVKNSFDAHATLVTIIFDDDKIVIKDNGKGMTHDDIINKWLFLAYSAKSVGTEDAGLNSNDLLDYRNKIQKKRFYAGAKGIGRLSCDRLGNKLNLISKNVRNNSPIEKLVIDWKDFERDPSDEFIKIPVIHSNPTQINYPDFNHGTILEISELPGESNWNRNKIKDLKHSLEKLINPFEELESLSNKRPSFQIEVQCDRELKDDKTTENLRDKINGPVKNAVFETLDVKTTHIKMEIDDEGKYITTLLVDRGTTLYKIKENNKTKPLLKGITIQLFYLNRAAKYNFKTQMGIDSVSFGSVFLYKNGFRVYPFGEESKDILGIDRRKQQGFNRYLGSRDLIGRIEIIDDENNFQETSSRDGGLIENRHYGQLYESFWVCFKRVERYVVGVQWFLKDLRKDDVWSTDISVLNNIEAKELIIDIVSRLADSKEIIKVQYNKDFLNIIEEKLEDSTPEALKTLANLAQKANDHEFYDELVKTQKQIEKLDKEKQDAEDWARKEEQKRQEAEDRLRQEELKNTFLLSTSRGISRDAQGLIHNIKLVATNIRSIIAILLRRASEDKLTKNDLLKRLTDIQFSNEKALKISQLITRANFKEQASKQVINIVKYLEQYIKLYGDIYEKSLSSTPLDFSFDDDGKEFWAKISVLELSIIIDNLISNSIKAEANKIYVGVETDKNGDCIITFSDNGNGLSKDFIKDPNQIFELGITDTEDGSGIGLFTARKALSSMKGEIAFHGNGTKLEGASFTIRIRK